jgi:hypothetical protein
MPDVIYPIFRTGTVLKTENETSGARAVDIGRMLIESSESFTKNLIKKATATALISRVEMATSCYEPRVRSHPAIVIDFPPISMYWRGHKIEFRACMTSLVGPRKAKVWSRFNFAEKHVAENILADFYYEMICGDETLHTFCEVSYAEMVSKKFGMPLENMYEILIQMASSEDSELCEMSTYSWPIENVELRKNLEKKINNIMLRNFDFNFAPDDASADRHYNLSSYALMDRKPFPGQPESPNTISKALTDVSVPCISVTDIEKNRSTVWGIVYDNDPPRDDFHHSASHAVSGEISFILGNLY